MTSIEKALTNALDRAWGAHYEEKPHLAFDHLYQAVKLLAGLSIHQEARSLPAGLPQEPPEAPAGTNLGPDWESRCNRLKHSTELALHWLSEDRADCARTVLEGALK